MAKLSPGQIYSAALDAGFPPAKAIIATAIALAESGGNTDANCLNCFPGVTEDSRGLWQINVDAHPDLKSLNLYDPATNARAAFQVSSGAVSFRPWSTYTSGAYSKFLGAASIAAGNPEPVPAGTSGTTAQSASKLNLNPFDGFGIPSAIANSLAKDALRVVIEGVLVLGGAALVVIGLYRTVQPTVTKVANVAGDAAKAAAIA